MASLLVPFGSRACMVSSYLRLAVIISLWIGLSLANFPANYRRLVVQRCQNGRFGYLCKFNCNCRGNQVCDKETGSCPSGCRRGYWGPGCQLRDQCYYNTKEELYMGSTRVTSKGKTCQRWSLDVPHAHTYNRSQLFPDKTFPENFCRALGSGMLWCYTTDANVRWQSCGIKSCNCPGRRFGPNCRKECHCKDSRNGCESENGECVSKECASGWGGYNCQTVVPCQPNRYGWHCENTCQCKDSAHCDRFLGPTSRCRCKYGYYDPPHCLRASPPFISGFFNEPVNPGQDSIFNCTVSAQPKPSQGEIQLLGPDGKKVTLMSFMDYVDAHSTVRSTFKVIYVVNNENYTCSVRTRHGQDERSMIARVYELPRLNTPPRVVDNSRGPDTVQLLWEPWDKSRGDSGDGPVLSYDVYSRHANDYNFTKKGQVFHRSCRHGPCTLTIDRLKPHSKYAVYVVACRPGQGGNGPPGPIIHVWTKCAAPGAALVIARLESSLQYNKTLPKTSITLVWKVPDPESNDTDHESINCNSVQTYFLTIVKVSVQRGSGQVQRHTRIVELPSTATGQYTLTGMEPYTEYCFDMAFENDAGLRSEKSEEQCVYTPQTQPDPPSSPEVREVTNDTVMLSWEQPARPNGEISQYRIVYWEGQEGPTIVPFDPKGQVEILRVLPGLKPNTFYRVQVFAVNEAGPGFPTETLTFTTDETVPGPVSSFQNVSVSARSLQFRWQPPAVNMGNITQYTLQCRMVDSLSSNLELPRSPPPQQASSLVIQMWVVRLTPATRYNCSIHATTRKGDGPKTSLLVWTDADELSAPRPPEIVTVTENTITLKFHESVDRTVSHYRVIVEKTPAKRKKRRVPQHISGLENQDYASSARDGQVAYVTAQIKPHRLRGNFVVGDNRTYDGFFNGPLKRGHEYNIWLAAFSQVNGKSQRVYVKSGKAETARSMAPASTPNSLPIIFGVIVVFILLIAIFALLLVMWRRRHLAEEREKADMPSFGPTILPEPETSSPPTPIENFEIEPLIEHAPPELLLESEPQSPGSQDVLSPIKVEDLWDYIRAAKQNDLEGLKREYKLLPAGITATCEVARKGENKMKNRYGNIIAYDHTRVILDPEDDDEHDDYINANYIDGYNKQRAYIAAQGANKPTINDIWRMVWKENTKTLIMLTNPTESGKKKCEQYWPDDGCGQYGNIAVQLLGVDVLPDFTVRTFLISKGGQSKYVKQFHYTTWPDHGVPRFGHSLLLFRQKIRAYDSLDNGTVVIHCSAGVGRTGTYIAVDSQLERAKSEGIIDVHNFVQLMRTQRVNMVQTMEQYVFVYDCLLEALICGDTTVSSHAFPEVYTDLCLYDHDIAKTKLEEQFEILKLLSTTIERDESTTALRPENIFKNRCKNIIPANRCRPYLMTVHDGSNDYINAVFLNSYCKKDQLLVTQMPLPNTVVDFWRLVYDHHSYCIVMLNEVERNDDTCEQYWTEDPGGVDYGPFQVETISEIKSNPIVTVRDFTVVNTETPGEAGRQVRQFHFHRWQEGAATPSSQRALLELVDLVCAWQTGQDGPVTVHCMNGAGRSGLFCAALTILERVKKEKEVDVFQAVKQLRLNRTQLIDNMDQFRFCHELVMEFLTNPSPSEVLS